MFYTTLPWSGPHPFATIDFDRIPHAEGVYVFTEYATRLAPNPPLPAPGEPGHEAAIEAARGSPGVLYLGKARSLRNRVRGYRFRPYLEIVRRPAGSSPRHEADRHKGRALLHAHQYFGNELFLWYACTSRSAVIEKQLLLELRPYLNTVGVDLYAIGNGT